MSAVQVSTREAELLVVARALVTPGGYASVAATLAGAHDVGKKISPSAMSVLEGTLAKGVVKALARLGGARPRVRPDLGSSKPARVFEVRPAPELAFGPYSFELLRWLTNTPLAMRSPAPFVATPRTLGDEICAYLALALVDGQRLEAAVASASGVATPLTWLGFARSLGRHAPSGGASAPSFDRLLGSEEGRTVVECMSGDLARRWAASLAWDPSDVLDAGLAVRIVDGERLVLDGFLDAVGRLGRWDLATFIVDAASAVLPPGVVPMEIAARATPRVRGDGTLRARTEARQRAGALLHALGRVGRKRDELAVVRFIDDGYDVAQATLASWEKLGRDAFTRAEQVLAALRSLP